MRIFTPTKARLNAVWWVSAAVLVLAFSGIPFAWAADELPVENAVLTAAPQVPPPITRDHPAKVIVSLDTTEQIGELSDGVQYVF